MPGSLLIHESLILKIQKVRKLGLYEIFNIMRHFYKLKYIHISVLKQHVGVKYKKLWKSAYGFDFVTKIKPGKYSYIFIYKN